jgi:hypothetical protein
MERLMALFKRVTGRATLLALLVPLMLAGSAAATTIGESGGTLTLAASLTSQNGDPDFNIVSYTDPVTNAPMVFFYDQNGWGDSAGQGCSGADGGEVTICDATALTSIVVESSAPVSSLSYTAYAGMAPIPLTANYNSSAALTETPAGQSVPAGGPYGLLPAGTTVAAPITINEAAPAGAWLSIDSGDGQATIN